MHAKSIRQGKPLLSLILPIYNQYDNLRENFPAIYDALRRDFGIGNFEIVFVDDGSRDRSMELERRFSKRAGVVLFSKMENGGRGSALKLAIPKCRGKVIGFIDTDLAVPMRFVKPAVNKVLEGHQVVIGSKYMKGVKYDRVPSRLIISHGSNLLAQVMLGSRVSDHQCGFKFWNSDYIRKYLHELKDNGWFFDTEMIVRAQRHGVMPYELPVEWRESKRSTFRIGHITSYFSSVVKMRFGLL
ncbi:MAG: glycosyltransferase [Candidatus Micrarchaeota archaeon]|nr:glycosyltransferase [Candidatus Micrarchaeota archaeon]